MKESNLIKLFFALSAALLILNVFFLLKNKKSIAEIDLAFIAHQKNIDNYIEKFKISHLTYDSQSETHTPQFSANSRLCSLAHEGVALEVHPETQTAYYWNDFNEESTLQSAQAYEYSINLPYLALSSKSGNRPHRLFQIIEIDDSTTEITGLAGGVDLYPEWCDSINSKN
jgi:hypothetical protein